MSAFVPSVSRNLVDMQMSPPATDAVETTPVPRRFSAKAAVTDMRVMEPRLPEINKREGMWGNWPHSRGFGHTSVRTCASNSSVVRSIMSSTKVKPFSEP